MTLNEINEICIDYIRAKLSPTKRERDFISSKYAELKNILNRRTFMNGSYARHTSTTPINDLDVFLILDDEKYPNLKTAILERSNLDVTNILETLAQLLRQNYPDNVTIKVQAHSVGIFFGDDNEFSIDVVPAISAEDGMFWVPDSSRISISMRRKFYENNPAFRWIKSHPKAYIKQAQNVDADSGGNFRKATKFSKKWKQGCKLQNDEFPLKSFHLELIITEFFKREPRLVCLSAIKSFLEKLSEIISEPRFRDKADETKFVDEYVKELTFKERSLVDAQIQNANDKIQKILNATTEAEVLKLIEGLLLIERKQPSANIIIGANVAAERKSRPYSKPYYFEPDDEDFR